MTSGISKDLGLGPIPEYLKAGMRERFLTSLKNSRSLDTYELDLFRWFITETEETWTRMDTEEQAFIKEQLDGGAEDINDSGVVAVDYYRKRMRSSHVVFLTSLLEGAMKRECDRVIVALGELILFKPAELKGDPWTARRVFLERHGAFETPEALSAPIRELLSLRNALVHHCGEAALLGSDEIARLRKIAGVAVDATYIAIEASYVETATAVVLALAEFLHEMTNRLIDRAISPKPI